MSGNSSPKTTRIKPDGQALSIEEFASRYRMGEKKVREMIRKGIVEAIDIGIATGRHQVRIMPEACRKFEELVRVRPAVPRQRKKKVRYPPEIMAILGED
jgi:hypothetical protein